MEQWLTLLATFLGVCGSALAIWKFATGRTRLLNRTVRRDMSHTPWLALQFEQDGGEVGLISRDIHLTEVILRRRPFRIIMPRHAAGNVYQICAWTDDSIFAEAPVSQSKENSPSFGPGTGIADATHASGTLFLNNEGHNHLCDERLRQKDENWEIYFGCVWTEGRQIPMEEVKGPLFLVVTRDRNEDEIMDFDEYEFLILRFTR